MTLDEIKAGIRELWSAPETLSTREIGARLGVTKNVVVGHAHRMNLPPRPSPIRRRPAIVTPQVIYSAARGEWLRQDAFSWTDEPAEAGIWNAEDAAVTAVTIAAHHDATAVDMPPECKVPLRRKPQAMKRGPGRSEIRHTLALPPVSTLSPTIFKPVHRGACCWPLGTPRTPTFKFCGDPAEVGRPYCAAHVALAYVRVRDRREDANAA